MKNANETGSGLAAQPLWLNWALLAAAGLAAGQVLARAGLPAGLLIGPILAGAALAQAGSPARMPKLAHQLGQGVLGCLIATHLDAEVLAGLGRNLPVVLAFVVLTFAAACIVGLACGRWTAIDREVSIWGFLPGMAGTVIAIAHERGLDSRLVALIQVVRLMVVIATMVVAAMFLSGAAAMPVSPGPAPDAGSTLAVLGACLAGVAAARHLRWFPAGASLVPMCLAAAMGIAGWNVSLPPVLIALAFLALGAQIGLRVTPELVRTGVRALPALVAASLLLMALCALSGGLLSLVAGVDLMSALLATVPGSIDSIALIAVNAHADVTFVMMLQTLRLFAVAGLGPFVARGLVQLTERRAVPR
ncbi:AbrB family transcriptional regulator [Poseidonocella sp. HB161398]|uniref:AbrB family transcriptional regulator n=1 Tax=Poseidonocella sp. HB161398 TaxID=2320855 RepID=UPI001108D48E|nr:AbrB family transcriptional regulator [Poseidonocella sp. HB161398]